MTYEVGNWSFIMTSIYRPATVSPVQTLIQKVRTFALAQMMILPCYTAITW